MKRSEYSRTLRMMETCRELSYEAETVKERRRLEAEYEAMWLGIRPYATGEAELVEDDMSAETTAWAAAGR